MPRYFSLKTKKPLFLFTFLITLCFSSVVNADSNSDYLSVRQLPDSNDYGPAATT